MRLRLFFSIYLKPVLYHAAGKVMQGMFKQVTDTIVTHIREAKADGRLQAASTIVLVGGFSESGHVKTAVGNAFPDDLVVAPKDPGLATLKVGRRMLCSRFHPAFDRIGDQLGCRSNAE